MWIVQVGFERNASRLLAAPFASLWTLFRFASDYPCQLLRHLHNSEGWREGTCAANLHVRQLLEDRSPVIPPAGKMRGRW